MLSKEKAWLQGSVENFNMAAKEHVCVVFQDLSVVELGFVEKAEDSINLTSPFFPSKTGGKPAWLALSRLPNSTQISCKNCEKSLVFLLQVYVPSDEAKTSAYHRTVFVFCCRNGACYKSNCNKCFAVFRCQLPGVNDFYSPELISQDEVLKDFRDRMAGAGDSWTQLCEVCGCRGEKLCGRCGQVRYCCKEHQAAHWKTGHKAVCNAVGLSTSQTGSQQQSSNVLFPEYELLTEPEDIAKDTLNDENEDSVRKYEEYLKDHENDEGISDKDWNTLEAESKKTNDAVEDKTYWEFKKRISIEPEQVLRYQRHGNPLWISKLNIVKESDIPKCSCGAERTFEFQILPQLLNHMKVDSLQASIDWGTLAIYTCSQNCCKEDTSYYEEFVWKQDFSNTGIPTDILSKLTK